MTAAKSSAATRSAELGGIFADHETAKYVTKARRVWELSESVALFQTTPAQLHGREELSEALTQELSEALTEQD